MSLPQRHIPRLDRDVLAVGYGCMGLSWAYTTGNLGDDDASVDLLGSVLDSGVGFLDTSDAYGLGHNERLVGRALAQWWGKSPVVATKAGLVGRQEGDDRPGYERDGSPEHLRAACDASLQRLGLDVIDLYYLHRVDPEVPLEESWGALADLVRAGKVRALGLSEVTPEQAERAHALHPVAAVQSELSLWTRDHLGAGCTADGDASGDMVAWTRDHDAALVPYAPLGRGFLTGRLTGVEIPAHDFRSNHPRFAAEARDANQRIVDQVRQIADRHGVVPGAVALAWVLAQGDHVIPIPGTTRLPHLHDNLSALDVSLSDDDLCSLDSLPPAVGSRY